MKLKMYYLFEGKSTLSMKRRSTVWKVEEAKRGIIFALKRPF